MTWIRWMCKECIGEWIIKQPYSHYVSYTLFSARSKTEQLITAFKELTDPYCTKKGPILLLSIYKVQVEHKKQVVTSIRFWRRGWRLQEWLPRNGVSAGNFCSIYFLQWAITPFYYVNNYVESLFSGKILF